MKIGLLTSKTPRNKHMNVDALNKNISILRSNSDDGLSKYIIKIYDQVFKTSPKSLKNIYSELEKNQDVEYFTDTSKMSSYNLTISPSHENAYHLIKSLNRIKEPLLVMCFDMHCDMYDASEELWKGNHFSKLMKEKYISNLIVYGLPKRKKEMTLNQIDQNYLDNVAILYSAKDICSYINNLNVKHIIFSIDIDCFDSLKSNYTAIPYSPYRILNELSNKKIKNGASKEVLAQISKECIYIKNRDGYENMYHVGENKFSIKKFKKIFNTIVEFCNQNNITIGYEKNGLRIVTDISEVDGDDINENTLHLIDDLVDILKEVK